MVPMRVSVSSMLNACVSRAMREIDRSVYRPG